MVDIIKTSAPDCVRIYDRGVKTWLTNNILLDGEVIPNVYASPEKVYGEMERLQGIGKKLRPILPFISITRVLSVKDPNRYNIVDINGVAWADAPEEGERGTEVYSTNYPVPVIIGYQFDVWMNFVDDKNKIETQFQLSFNHPVYLNFLIDDKIGEKSCYFNLESVNDTSTLEPSLRENRVFRNTYSCNLNAFLYYGYYNEKTVSTYDFELYVAKQFTANMDVIDENEWTLEYILTGEGTTS